MEQSIKPPVISKRVHPGWVKAVVATWMFIVVFASLILFGPPEIWLFMERLGLATVLQSLKSWLEPFFTADYMA